MFEERAAQQCGDLFVTIDVPLDQSQQWGMSQCGEVPPNRGQVLVRLCRELVAQQGQLQLRREVSSIPFGLRFVNRQGCTRTV